MESKNPQTQTLSRDLPMRVYRFMALAYALIFALAVVIFGQSRETGLVLSFAILIATMMLGIPFLLFRLDTKHRHARRLASDEYRQDGLETWTSHLSSDEASLQILLIPFALALAMLLIASVFALTSA